MKSILKELGIDQVNYGACSGIGKWSNSRKGGLIKSVNPATGELIASVYQATELDYDIIVQDAEAAFKDFRKVPAPIRGQLVREMGDALREKKDALGGLVSMEMGKIKQEGVGEVQEMIDIADFAVGQSRMLYGKTMHSERPDHRMYEQWHPRGPIGVISAFNFPVAVWSWNTALAWICGDVCVWKASEKAPLCSIACQNIIAGILKENNLPYPKLSKAVLDDRIRLFEKNNLNIINKDISDKYSIFIDMINDNEHYINVLNKLLNIIKYTIKNIVIPNSKYLLYSLI